MLARYGRPFDSIPNRDIHSGSVRTRSSSAGVLGFSSKSITLPALSIRMIPQDIASCSATGRAAIVASALFSTWVRIISWKSIR